MGKIEPIARVVTIVGGKLAAVGGCDDVFGRAESAPWESAHIAMPNAFLGVAKFWSRATPRFQNYLGLSGSPIANTN